MLPEDTKRILLHDIYKEFYYRRDDYKVTIKSKNRSFKISMTIHKLFNRDQRVRSSVMGGLFY